ncbi:hypothetical protein D9M71_276490 [compost metagenome]
MGVARQHVLQHGPGNTPAPMAGQYAQVGYRARLGIVFQRQVQDETHNLRRVLLIQRHHQFDRHAARAIHAFEVQMHFIAEAVLVQAVQRIARGNGNHADIGHVVDHHLHDLAFD